MCPTFRQFRSTNPNAFQCESIFLYTRKFLYFLMREMERKNWARNCTNATDCLKFLKTILEQKNGRASDPPGSGTSSKICGSTVSRECVASSEIKRRSLGEDTKKRSKRREKNSDEIKVERRKKNMEKNWLVGTTGLEVSVNVHGMLRAGSCETKEDESVWDIQGNPSTSSAPWRLVPLIYILSKPRLFWFSIFALVSSASSRTLFPLSTILYEESWHS